MVAYLSVSRHSKVKASKAKGAMLKQKRGRVEIQYFVEKTGKYSLSVDAFDWSSSFLLTPKENYNIGKFQNIKKKNAKHTNN